MMIFAFVLACHPQQFDTSDTDPDSDRPDTDVDVHDPLRNVTIPDGFTFEATRNIPVSITIPASDLVSQGVVDIATPQGLVLYRGPLSTGGKISLRIPLPRTITQLDVAWTSRGQKFPGTLSIPADWTAGPIAYEIPVVDPPAPPAAPDSDGDTVSDAIDVFPCVRTAAAISFVPSETGWSQVGFDSNWPTAGDLDFNDVSLAWHVRRVFDADGATTQLEVWISVLSLDNALPLGLGLHMPLPLAAGKKVRLRLPDGTSANLPPFADESDVVLPIYADLSTAFAISGPVNVEAGVAAQEPTTLVLAFDFDKAPPASALDKVPFDLFLYDRDDRSRQVHLPIWPGTSTFDKTLLNTGDDASKEGVHFVAKGGVPWGLSIPEQVGTPTEGTSISAAWPSIVQFASSGGVEAPDWWRSPDNTLVYGGALPARAPVIPKLKVNTECLP